MTDEPAAGHNFVDPLCPNCRESLREAMHHAQVSPKTADGAAPLPTVTVVFCGSCGFTLDVAQGRPGASAVPGVGGIETVATPGDDESLDGQFQIRCRDMVTETRSLGFNPNVWVSLINTVGAVGAARKLLADHHVLVATPWLVARHRPELTIEHEIGQPRWRELFTEGERVEAAHRLASLSESPP
jgi:hypothetical protein